MISKEQRLKNLKNLPIEEGFKVPEGLYIPFGQALLIKEVKQGEIKSSGGIIMHSPTQKTIGASIGIIYAIGENVMLPVHLGMKVYYDPTTLLRVFCRGEEYLQIADYLIFGAATPESYLEPHSVTDTEKRRAKRIESQQKAEANSDNILAEKIEKDLKKK